MESKYENILPQQHCHSYDFVVSPNLNGIRLYSSILSSLTYNLTLSHYLLKFFKLN